MLKLYSHKILHYYVEYYYLDCTFVFPYYLCHACRFRFYPPHHRHHQTHESHCWHHILSLIDLWTSYPGSCCFKTASSHPNRPSSVICTSCFGCVVIIIWLTSWLPFAVRLLVLLLLASFQPFLHCTPTFLISVYTSSSSFSPSWEAVEIRYLWFFCFILFFVFFKDSEPTFLFEIRGRSVYLLKRWALFCAHSEFDDILLAHQYFESKWWLNIIIKICLFLIF